MSHPQQTSLSSRELADRIVEELTMHQLVSRDTVRDLAGCEPVIAALIDAWVRVRELKAQIKEHEILCENGESCYRRKELESALTTARKQLEGATHGQAEAPSTAASANSEPGGV